MENKNLNLELTVEEANIVLQAVAKLPYEVVFRLMDKISQQAQSQLQQPTQE